MCLTRRRKGQTFVDEPPCNFGHSVSLVQVVSLGRLVANKVREYRRTSGPLGQSILYLFPLAGVSNAIPTISTVALGLSSVHYDSEASGRPPEGRLVVELNPDVE